MKAIRMYEPGDASKLLIEELEPHPLSNGEVRIQLEASGVNFIDIYHRSGLYPVPLPYTLGLEGAGRVIEISPDVREFSVGDRVAFANVPGAYADEIVAPAASLVKVNDGVSSEVAAAVMLQGMTAHYLACSTFSLSPGKSCLVHGAAGGVGLLLTQIAKLRGATVFGSCSKEKDAAALDAGADFIVGEAESNFSEEITRLTKGEKIDVVYDGIGKTTFEQSLKSLKPRGLLVSFGQSSGPVENFNPRILNLHGSLYLTRPSLQHYTATREELMWRSGELFSWIVQGKLNVTIGTRFSLQDAAPAHRALEGRKTSGKVLLLP